MIPGAKWTCNVVKTSIQKSLVLSFGPNKTVESLEGKPRGKAGNKSLTQVRNSEREGLYLPKRRNGA